MRSCASTVGSRSDPPEPAERARGRAVLGPSAFGCEPGQPFPSGLWVDIDPEVRRPTPTALFGGTPSRLLVLSRRAAELVSAYGTGPVVAGESARLARRLTDVGMATPRAGRAATPVDVTVVVPVRDRPVGLSACLGALGDRHRVIVVDDGSIDPEAVVAVCRAHGAEVVRRKVPGGPAAARNTGLRLVTSELVAFVDSDCLPGADWIEALAGHLADPLVVAVAPRIVAAPPRRGVSLLDLGSRPALVRPHSRVSYVPAAAVVFRRAALGEGFDENLRFGEDVDLIWRLVEAGWRIRYAPEVQVGHQDPVGTLSRLRRQYAYGSSVGALERRHPGAVVHLTIGVGPACAIGGVLLGRPGLGAFAWSTSAVWLYRRLRPLGVGVPFALQLSVLQLLHAVIGLGRWCTTFGGPLVIGSMVASRAPAGRRVLRALALLSAPALLSDLLGPNGRNPRTIAESWLRAMAYGVGATTGCIRAGLIAPVLPRIRSWSSAARFGHAHRRRDPSGGTWDGAAKPIVKQDRTAC